MVSVWWCGLKSVKFILVTVVLIGSLLRAGHCSPDCGVPSSAALSMRRRPPRAAPLPQSPSLGGKLKSASKAHRLHLNNLVDRNATRERKGRIIMGRETDDGDFPWQVSLQLLHPSLGFIGHWCGGVLIDHSWIISAAHCVHNELFNYPIPNLWTAVLGEYDRHVESGREQRISVDRIVMHKNYENYQHDLVLMRLARPVKELRKICLPFISTGSHLFGGINGEDEGDLDQFDGNSNNLRKLDEIGGRGKQQKRRNDKFFQDRRNINNRVSGASDDYNNNNRNNNRNSNNKISANYNRIRYNDFNQRQRLSANINDLPYRDCIATGWGMMTINGELTDILLQSRVPILSNQQCRRVYGGYVKIHPGHLCGGKAGGEGGTCVGDSGGPLQCRITKNGPWILAGITSFGWNCSVSFPDVFTRISYYVNWITETIQSDR